VISSNLNPISHRFRNTCTTTYSLKLVIKNCGQTSADGDIVTIDSLLRPIRRYHRWPSTTYCLATISHDWHTIVRYNLSRLSIVRLHISDQQQPTPYLAPFSHNTSVTDDDDDRQTTDDCRQPYRKFDRYLSIDSNANKIVKS